MREVYFINANKDKWQRFENLNKQLKKVDANELTDLYAHAVDDLAYSRTFYPNSNTTQYLNQITADVHNEIYKTKKEEIKRLFSFWSKEIPLLFAEIRKSIIISLSVLLLGILIGVLSSANDETYVRLILGDNYVNKTIENIQKGDPMAVYKSANEITMFIGITFNNIQVAFYAFVLGVLFSIGTVYILFTNGVMLGCFQYFFFKYDLFFESFRTIWIHGTLEVSAIVIAGAAGIVIGNSLVFPGTYSRKESFLTGAKKGIKSIIAVIPMFIVAGFLEAFVTRHNDMPLSISMLIILLSFCFVIWYFIIYPSVNKGSLQWKTFKKLSLNKKEVSVI